ncbi:aldehyde oxidase 1-like [Trichoplusia ni]|uniref:Aldehyde oxidase 1-like n=2 Tax=Trichoplusia ni TaxID=7111 RepID=A0A7E5WM94_TRINI|nr:aldehyde oxidase 1-like [Trichoplusia ni]
MSTAMDVLKFKVNGKEHTVGSNVSSDVMLVDYLRNYLNLRGTKYMCREGGCGACIVTASKTAGGPFVSVNSCLVSVGSCHGWEIKTIEGLGNRKDGYHPLQKSLAENNGTQCGYCSSGWIMAMHGFMESKKEATMMEVQNAFGSNLCRCTGYRPILEAFKKFAKDAPKEDRLMSLKNLSLCKTSKGGCCKSGCDDEEDWCMVREDDLGETETKKIVLKDGKIWYRPRLLKDVYQILGENLESYMLVGGNTAKGAFLIAEYPNALIDITAVQELRTNELDQNLVVGAGLTLTEFMDILKEGSKVENFSYFEKLYNHIELVAHIPIRNVGTIGGNLMIKHTYTVFQSDIFLLLDTVGAQLTISDYKGKQEVVTMQHFLTIDMKGKVIINIMLPPLNNTYKLYTYKLMPRAQSAHAIVNCGFLYKLNCKNIVEDARITYGALSTKFTRAPATEKYLVGKPLFTNDTLQGALRVLDGEMIVEEHRPEPSPEVRRYIAKALFFKVSIGKVIYFFQGLLSLCPSEQVQERLKSGITKLTETRPVSTGKQTYVTDPSLYPMNQPMPRLEAQIQCAGEAQYTDDIATMANEVFGAFVLSTVALGTIIKMDATDALKLPGVVAFYTAKDIPGLNSFTPNDGAFTTQNEEVLSEGTIKYYGQPIGIIVAEDQHVANRAAALVKVKYSNLGKPITDIIKARTDSTRNTLFTSIDATATGSDIHKTLTGTNYMHGQYHCSMETMVCVAKPTEEGLEVHLASQWLDGPHVMISRALNIEKNKIDLHIRRVGGSYGLKITRSIQAAVACSLVVQKLNRPCRFIQPLVTNMTGFGKRMPNVVDYEAAVNSSGVLQYVNTTIYTDNGHMINEPCIVYGTDTYHNCYDASKYNYKAYNTVTDTPKNTFCRSPGTLEAIASAELIMERISYELSLDPVAVRVANLEVASKEEMNGILENLKTSAEYVSRRAAVDSFNAQNRWKKRGLRWAFCRWPPAGGANLDINLSVYHADGSIIITHGGVEMGQGINTKVAQVAAYLLKVPLEKNPNQRKQYYY